MPIFIGAAMAACAVYDPSLAGNDGATGGGSSTGESGAGTGGVISTGSGGVDGVDADIGGASGSDASAAGGATPSTTGTSGDTTTSAGGTGGGNGSGAGGKSSAGGSSNAGGNSSAGGSANAGGNANAGGSANAGGASGGGGKSGAGGAAGATGEGGAAGATGGGGARGGAGGVTNGSGGAGGMAGATGGAAGTGSGQGGSSDAGASPVLDLIDDMEDGDQFVLNRNGRDGSWFASGDGTSGSTLQPASTAVYTMGTIVPPRGASTRASHLVGQGFKIWGAVIGVKPRADATLSDGGLQPIAYDATGYCGVHFFAMGSGTKLRMDIPDKYTNPAGGICNPNDTTGQTACFDHFGTALTLTPAWTEFTIPFSSLHDQGTSAISTTFHPEAIFQIEVSSRDLTGGAFEIWIDDISFIVKPAGGACP